MTVSSGKNCAGGAVELLAMTIDEKHVDSKEERLGAVDLLAMTSDHF